MMTIKNVSSNLKNKFVKIKIKEEQKMKVKEGNIDENLQNK